MLIHLISDITQKCFIYNRNSNCAEKNLKCTNNINIYNTIAKRINYSRYNVVTSQRSRKAVYVGPK